jgi:hypothetical protein
MSQRFIQNPWLTDVFTTPGAAATPSAATSFSVPSGASGYVEMIAHGRNTATNVGGVARVGRTFQAPGGVLALTGSLIILVGGALGVLVGDATIVAALANFTSSGVIVQPQVTGIAVTNIEWMLDVRYWLN